MVGEFHHLPLSSQLLALSSPTTRTPTEPTRRRCPIQASAYPQALAHLTTSPRKDDENWIDRYSWIVLEVTRRLPLRLRSSLSLIYTSPNLIPLDLVSTLPQTKKTRKPRPQPLVVRPSPPLFRQFSPTLERRQASPIRVLQIHLSSVRDFLLQSCLAYRPQTPMSSNPAFVSPASESSSTSLAPVLPPHRPRCPQDDDDDPENVQYLDSRAPLLLTV